VIRLSEVELQALKSGLIGILSPQLSRDILWFFAAWTDTYLLHWEEQFSEVSNPPWV